MDDTGEWILLQENGAFEGGETLGRGYEGPDECDDICRQRDEASVMAAMYGPSFSEISMTEWLFQCELAKGVVGKMQVTLPTDYPSSSAPDLTLDIPGCNDLTQAHQSFLDEYVMGKEVGFAWGERFHQLCRRSADQLQAIAMKKCADRSARLEKLKAAKTPMTAMTPGERRQLHRPSDSTDLYCLAVREGYDRLRYGDKVDGGPSRSELLAENRRLALAAEQYKKQERQKHRELLAENRRLALAAEQYKKQERQKHRLCQQR
eukprot:TRINITY_DN4792_c0_g1_i1.p1 TRINITY_DN4792_c0_g1~~TRINITY_DN4792_c0_g1_i1.p1  ORF type:complete len:279 (+),score=47.38 TRINITY_DN4792_c0_g1_i1:49-837(+)